MAFIWKRAHSWSTGLKNECKSLLSLISADVTTSDPVYGREQTSTWPMSHTRIFTFLGWDRIPLLPRLGVCRIWTLTWKKLIENFYQKLLFLERSNVPGKSSETGVKPRLNVVKLIYNTSDISRDVRGKIARNIASYLAILPSLVGFLELRLNVLIFKAIWTWRRS